ncbi:hypothetical protein GF342_00690 [Candidatus Woesearchaeota archaeon]|nr:hypothetical protein [Candidatus Woesearchaeota archaeon]
MKITKEQRDCVGLYAGIPSRRRTIMQNLSDVDLVNRVGFSSVRDAIGEKKYIVQGLGLEIDALVDRAHCRVEYTDVPDGFFDPQLFVISGFWPRNGLMEKGSSVGEQYARIVEGIRHLCDAQEQEYVVRLFVQGTPQWSGYAYVPTPREYSELLGTPKGPRCAADAWLSLGSHVFARSQVDADPVLRFVREQASDQRSVYVVGSPDVCKVYGILDQLVEPWKVVREYSRPGGPRRKKRRRMCSLDEAMGDVEWFVRAELPSLERANQGFTRRIRHFLSDRSCGIPVAIACVDFWMHDAEGLYDAAAHDGFSAVGLVPLLYDPQPPEEDEE